MEPSTITIWHILRSSVMIWPILLCSVAALALVAERLAFFWSIRLDTRPFLSKVLEQVKRHQIKEALAVCDAVTHPLANVLKAGILKYDRPRSQIKEAIEDASLYETPKLEKNLPALATIAHIAPLLGLLGTAVGMARSFAAITLKSASLQTVAAQDVAGGMWEAVLATVAGLAVAIPAFIAYNFLVGLVNNTLLDMERAATELVNFLTD